jgi:CHAD domain-containing protein
MRKLIKYGNKRFTCLNTGLKKYKQYTKPEQLHEIRVELKKIKTLFNFLASGSKQFNAATVYKPLKQLFKKAGIIRESDVLHQLFKDYKLERFEKAIILKTKGQKKVIAKFHKKTTQYIKTTKQIHKKFERYFTHTNTTHLRKYISKIERQLCEKLFQKFNQDKLHPIRKQVKELIYLSQITNAENNLQKIETFNKLQDAIGNWHDKTVLIDLLQKKQNPLYKESIKKLKLACTRDIKLIKSLMNASTIKHIFY